MLEKQEVTDAVSSCTVALTDFVPGTVQMKLEVPNGMPEATRAMMVAVLSEACKICKNSRTERGKDGHRVEFRNKFSCGAINSSHFEYTRIYAYGAQTTRETVLKLEEWREKFKDQPEVVWCMRMPR